MPAAHAARPNIVYIHSHDTGRYLQPYGYAVPTPNIQKLAEQGLLFRQAYSAAPTCSPSRAALLTGQCPHQAGMIGLAHRGFPMTDFSRHIVHTLRKAGYESALAGVQHIAQDPNGIGYDRVLCAGKKHEQYADTAVEFLRGRMGQSAPFFLDIGFFETHRYGGNAEGYYTSPGPSGDPRYVRPPAPLPDLPRVRQDMADYIESAKKLDANMGRVFAALDDAGLADNTLVICTTDHGLAFPGMKCNLTDHGIGVNLILRGPGPFSGGRVTDALVSQIDLYPTLCDLLGVERPAWLEGKSLMPVVRGEVEQVNDEVFAEISYHASYEPVRAVRTARYKYVRRFDGRTRRVLPNCDDGTSRSELLAQGWRDKPIDTEALYDLVFDPNEAANLAGDVKHRAVLEEMRQRLDAWMRRTQDPLILHGGRVPSPPGAKVNDADGLSPYEPVIDAKA